MISGSYALLEHFSHQLNNHAPSSDHCTTLSTRLAAISQSVGLKHSNFVCTYHYILHRQPTTFIHSQKTKTSKRMWDYVQGGIVWVRDREGKMSCIDFRLYTSGPVKHSYHTTSVIYSPFVRFFYIFYSSSFSSSSFFHGREVASFIIHSTPLIPSQWHPRGSIAFPRVSTESSLHARLVVAPKVDRCTSQCSMRQDTAQTVCSPPWANKSLAQTPANHRNWHGDMKTPQSANWWRSLKEQTARNSDLR